MFTNHLIFFLVPLPLQHPVLVQRRMRYEILQSMDKISKPKMKGVMNKSELIDELATRTGYKPILTDKMVRIFFDRIKVALRTGDKVEIRGFGSFTLKKYRGYTGRNPKTGEKVEVKPKQLPVFRTGKDLRSRVNR